MILIVVCHMVGITRSKVICVFLATYLAFGVPGICIKFMTTDSRHLPIAGKIETPND